MPREKALTLTHPLIQALISLKHECEGGGGGKQIKKS